MGRILIIDDDEQVLSTVRRHLERTPHELMTALNGKQALDLVRNEVFDLVITDVYMPEVDGIEFTTQLRATRPDVKLVAMSGGGVMDQDEVLEVVARLGAACTLAKPFTHDELLQAVGDALATD